MGSTMGDLARILSDSGRGSDLPLVWNAYEMARLAHRGQRRANGEHYITHPVEVATFVARQQAPAAAVCAALLHDVVEDAGWRPAVLHREFGPEVATIVEDLTAPALRTDTGARTGTMLVSIADRLHNLRTLRPLPAATRQRVALDTLLFHVPLARRLGLPAVAAEMTDLACEALAALDNPGSRFGRQRVATLLSRADPRWAADAVGALGGGAALVSGGAAPAWLLAAGGAGALAVLTSALFSRDPKAAERLSELIAAWRRR